MPGMWIGSQNEFGDQVTTKAADKQSYHTLALGHLEFFPTLSRPLRWLFLQNNTALFDAEQEILSLKGSAILVDPNVNEIVTFLVEHQMPRVMPLPLPGGLSILCLPHIHTGHTQRYFNISPI